MATMSELEAKINKIDASLKRTEASAVRTKEKMESGDWGTHQLKDLQAQLDRFNASIARNEAKKLKLIDQQSTRDFEILNKQIQSVMKNLSQLNRDKAAMGGTGAAGANRTEADFRAIETAIKNAERALASFQSRKFTQFNAQGKRKTADDIGPFGPVDMEARLGPRNPQYTYADADLQARIGPNRSGRTYSPYTGPFAGYANSVSANYVPGGFGLNRQGGFGNQPYGPERDPFNGMGENSNPGGTTKQLSEKEKLILKLKEERAAWLAANKAMLEYAKTQGIKDPERAYRSTLLGGADGAYDISTFKERNAMGELNTLKVKSDKQGQLSNLQPQKAQQSFAQGITKDIGDLLKWSVAISAIYGPINAMSEAMAQLIENESKLADVSIFLSNGLASTERVFSTVASSAQASGESIAGVIDAFGAAYTAAGRITNEAERYASATTLLNDALALSKISTLDQAGAIDVLTAALYQTAESQDEVSTKLGRTATQSEVAANALDNGRNLLDQWVLVSKSAAVSVETLATGVAVLGDSAETAGLSIEQMNSMVATLSEVSLSSGKETANIAKALIGNYQQESAVKELNRLGIAVTDTTGKTRQFLDVMKDVYALRKGGILGDQDFNRLTLALGGGGIRRQKDVAAFIENMDRMEQLTKIQESGAGGQTELAMAKKLDTVQTSATRLQNSFVSLAQTMGTKGGLLDVFSVATDGATLLIDAINGISSAIGRVAPLLLAAGVGSILMRGRGGAAGLQSMMMNNLGMGAGLAGGLAGTRSIFSPNGTGTTYGANGPTSSMLPMTFGQKMTTAPMLGAIALPAIQNMMSGNTEEAGGNIAGGILGALATGGNPIGALIGSAIGEAFVRTTMTYDKSFVDLFSGKNQPKDETDSGVGSTKESLESLTDAAYKTVGSFAAWNEFNESTTKAAGTPKERWDAFISAFTGKSDIVGADKTISASAMRKLEEIDPEQAKSLRLRMAEEGLLPEGYKTRQTREQLGWSSQSQLDSLNKMQTAEMDRLKTGVIGGDIKQSDYANRMASLSAFTTTATGWMAAVTDESGNLNKAFESNADAWQQFILIMGSGNQEAIKNINSLISEATHLQDILDNWDPKTGGVDFSALGQDFSGVTDKNTVQNASNAVLDAVAAAIRNSADNAQLQQIDAKVRDVYGSNTEATSAQDVNTVTQEAIKLQNQYYSNLTKKEYEVKKDSFEEFYMWIEEGGKYIYKKIVDSAGKNLDKNLFGAAFQDAQANGRISSSKDSGIDWQVSTATEAQIRAAEAKAPAFTKMLQDKGVTGLDPLTETVMTTSEKSTIVAHGDQKVIQYLLQQILDTEKKQLQGVWNLPEGSSFWVPLQSMIDTAGTGTDGVVPGDDGQKAKEVNQADLSNTTKEDFFKKLNMTPRGSVATMTKEDYLNQFSTARGATGPMERQQGLHNEMLDMQKPDAAAGGIGQLLQWLRGLLPNDPTGPMGGGRGGGIPGDGAFRGKAFSPSDNSQAVTQTRMDIKFTSTMNLMVDGRVLASVVKPYLASDLMKTNESGGTITRSYVI